MLFHLDRLVLALRLFPERLLRHAPQLVPCVGDRLQRAVLRVRAARLEGHHERLSGGVHDRVGDQEAGAIEARDDFQAHARPRFRAGLPPLVLGAARRRQQRIEVRFGIGDAERQSERRLLRADVPDGAGLGQRKALAEQRVEGGLAGLGRALAVVLGTGRFRIRAPVAALADGLHRAVERRAVAFEQGMGQGKLLRNFP